MIKVSYDKLFAFLYRNNLSKSQVAKEAGISRNSLIKMSKGEIVHLEILLKICETYGLQFDEAMDITITKK